MAAFIRSLKKLAAAFGDLGTSLAPAPVEKKALRCGSCAKNDCVGGIAPIA